METGHHMDTLPTTIQLPTMDIGHHTADTDTITATTQQLTTNNTLTIQQVTMDTTDIGHHTDTIPTTIQLRIMDTGHHMDTMMEMEAHLTTQV
jgi:hypothetical protein